jgi:hypothetical protein
MKNLESEFIPYSLALRMKTLGFNENCYRVGNPNGAICWRFMDVAGVEGVGIDDILLEKFDKLWWVEISTFSQAFSWLIPQIEEECKVCLDENGWYIYNLENEIFKGNEAVAKLIEIIEKK